jgi:hypothetical protein
LKIGLSLLGWIHLVLGLLGLVPGVLLCGAILLSDDPAYRDLITIFAPVFGFLSVAYFIPSFVGGLGLLRGRPWARAVIWVESALLVFAIPIGTVLAGLSMWVLLSHRDQAESYGSRIHAVERWLASKRELFLAALAAIGTLGAMIGLGYLFRDQIEDLNPPMKLVGPVIFVVTVAIVALIGGVNAWGGGIAAWSPERLLLRRRMQREQAERVAEHKARLVRLLADPVRAKYVERMERGDYWSDEQIAYDLDRAARATCQHLAPVEGAMREVGLMVKWQQPGFIDAECLIDEAALKRTGLLAKSVSYREIESGGRAYEDPPFGMLQCAACNASIRVRSEQEARPGIRVFPAPTVSDATER